VDSVAALANDIKELGEALLDDDVRSVVPPDDLSRRQQLLISSFVILCHAHIEEYLENLFVAYVQARELELTKEFAPHCFMRLSIHFAADIVGQQVAKESDHLKICITAKHLYTSKVVWINNGLKEANVKALAKPLGLNNDDLSDGCEQLFAALNTLGGKRGKVAHSSSMQSANETFYAAQAVSWVDDVVSQMHQLVQFLGLE
jgi:hypothetical protein